MIQDIEPRVYDNVYREQEIDDSSYIIYFKNKMMMAGVTDEGLIFPTLKNWPGVKTGFTYLLNVSGQKFFLADTDEDITIPGFEMRGATYFRTTGPKYMSFAGITCYHLADWYDNNRYCGRCGRKLTKDTRERMLYCSECGNTVYPKISPAIIVAITDGDRILLTKYNGREYKKFSLVAGFVEIGETLEDTVRREVMEEVGLKVKNLRYFKSQPWAFTECLLTGFVADLDGSDEIVMDPEELSVAQWVNRDELDPDIPDLSLTNTMIKAFYDKLI